MPNSLSQSQDAAPLLVYPTAYEMKVFVLSDQEVQAHILKAVQTQVSDFFESMIQSIPSRNGKYTAYRISFTAKSETHVKNIYDALMKISGVRLVI